MAINPLSTSKIIKKIANLIDKSKSPSRESTKKDLMHVRHAIAGNKSSYKYLISRFSGVLPEHDLLKQVDRVFIANNVYPPFLKKQGNGYYTGNIGGGIELEIGVSGGRIDKVAVAGRLARDLSEAPGMYKFLISGSIAQGPGQDVSRDGDPDTYKCDNCNEDIRSDNYGSCPKCGIDHVQCPGCEGRYDMNKNTNDKCPLCGYSSWGDDENEPLNPIE